MKRRSILMILWLTAAFSLTATDIAKTAPILPGYHRRAVEQRLQSRLLDDKEGIWYYPEEGLTLAIERDDDNNLRRYRLVVVESIDKAVDVGAVAGYMMESADPTRLRLWLYSEINCDDKLSSPVDCVAEISNKANVIIHKKKLKFRASINLTRFLPSIFGGLRLYPQLEKESIEPGMKKIWPTKKELTPIVF